MLHVENPYVTLHESKKFSQSRKFRVYRYKKSWKMSTIKFSLEAAIQDSRNILWSMFYLYFFFLECTPWKISFVHQVASLMECIYLYTAVLLQVYNPITIFLEVKKWASSTRDADAYRASAARNWDSFANPSVLGFVRRCQASPVCRAVSVS